MRRNPLLVLLLAVPIALGGCSTPADTASGANGSAPASVSTPAGDPDALRGLALTVPIPRPAFTLTDDSGAAYDFAAETAGVPTFLFFGYTRCPDICPTTMADVAVAIRELDPALAEQVRVVFVTTDPDFDTAPVLREFLDHFDGDLPHRFVGLTGPLADVEAAQRAAKITVAEDNGRSHSALLQFYGPDDLARVAYAGGTDPVDMAHDVATLL